MAQEKEAFRPDGCRTAISKDGKEVSIRFCRDGGDSREVVLARNQLPLFVTELRKKLSPNDALPIDPGSMKAGERFVIAGYGMSSTADRFCLDLGVEIVGQGRGVRLPLQFTRDEVEDLIEEMMKWLRRSGR